MSYFETQRAHSAERVARELGIYRERLAAGDPIAHDCATYPVPVDEMFSLWLYLVNRIAMRRVGMSTFDLPDYLWRDAYDDGLPPAEAWSDYLLSIEDEFNLDLV